MFMKSGKSLDLQSASWTPRRTDGVVPVWMPSGSKPRKSQCFNLSPKAGKTLMSQFKAVRQDEFPLPAGGTVFLFYSSLQLIGWGSPTLGRAVCFTQSTNSNINLIQRSPHRHTQNGIWPNVWVPHDPVKITHKFNHHTTL